MNKIPIAVHTGDVHLCDKVPVARSGEEDWRKAQFRVLDEVASLCKKLSATLIIGGDLFDKPTLSFSMLNEMQYHLPISNGVICLLGNHEEPYNNTSSGIEDSVWKTATYMRLFEGVSTPVCIHLGNFSAGVSFAFIPATNSEECFKKYVDQVNLMNADIVVLHKQIWNKEEDRQNAPVSGNAENVSKLFPNVKCIFASDNHIGWDRSDLSPRVYNCGALIRHSAALIDYRPRVYILYDDFSVDIYYLDISSDKISNAHIIEEMDRKDKEAKFLNTIICTNDCSFSFKDNLNRLLSDKEDIKKYINMKLGGIK